MSNIDIYENVEDVFDSGESEYSKSKTAAKNKNRSKVKDSDYLKVYKYTNTLFAFKGIPLSYVPFVVEIGRYMSYADDGQIVVLNKYIKDKISETLNIKTDRINQAIRELKACDVLRPTGSRGVYAVNPFVIGCGDSMQIEELRAQFDFDADLMVQKNITHNLITGKVIQRVVKERKDKQIPGQQSLFDDKYLGEKEQAEQPAQPKKTRKSAPKKNQFNQFMQRDDYNMDEIESYILDENN